MEERKDCYFAQDLVYEINSTRIKTTVLRNKAAWENGTQGNLSYLLSGDI
jgi:hypothetical protein